MAVEGKPKKLFIFCFNCGTPVEYSAYIYLHMPDMNGHPATVLLCHRCAALVEKKEGKK